MSVLTAGAGKKLRKGDVFASKVDLGVSDSAENWQEVDEREYQEFLAAQQTEPDDVDLVLDAWEAQL